MTKRELRELVKSVIKEFTGTGSSGGNATDGNDITSPRPFHNDEDEVDNYMNKNSGEGGQGKQTRGMEPVRGAGNLNRTKMTRM